MRTNGQPRGQLFLKRWTLSNLNQTKSIMNKQEANHHQNSDTKTITYYNYCRWELYKLWIFKENVNKLNKISSLFNYYNIFK